MDKKELDKIIKYNEHAIFMAEIAVKLLENDDYVLITKGVRELIAMYLLIPYITNSQLEKPKAEKYNIPQCNTEGVFAVLQAQDGNEINITLDGLRNAICHSFVTIEENKLILDDRASCDRKTHDALIVKDYCNCLDIDITRTKLLKLHKKIIEAQKDFNDKLSLEEEVDNE